MSDAIKDDGGLARDNETLRDRFASYALIAHNADPLMRQSIITVADKNGIAHNRTFAVMAYEYADAMLEARKD